MDGNREQWRSKIGFIAAAAGSAIGLGNVWRFPYLVGMNGGAAFVIVYVILAVTVGITVMLAEFCLGRAMRLNAVSALKAATKNPIWRAAGWSGVLAGGFVILSYYGIIAGWTIRYMIGSFTGLMEVAAAGGSGEELGGFLGNTPSVVGYQAAAMLITTIIVATGIGRGIERACKVMMPALFVLLLILIVRAVTLPGASAGLEFYLKPDFSKLTGKSVLDALGQSFYSLSLGMGIMVTYGSYIKKGEKLHTSGMFILVTDTFAAFLAGLAIFPAVFAAGIEPTVGVTLTFVTLPGVFAAMPGGAFFSGAFFLLLFFASVTSMMSLLEVAVSFLMDEFGMKRPSASWLSGIAITAAGVPSAMSLAGGVEVMGMAFFDFADSISNNIMMPLCAIGISLFVGWAWSDRARREITNDGTVEMPFLGAWMLGVRFFAPLMIVVILVTGWPF